jgi:hypothetical protein
VDGSSVGATDGAEGEVEGTTDREMVEGLTVGAMLEEE